MNFQAIFIEICFILCYNGISSHNHYKNTKFIIGRTYKYSYRAQQLTGKSHIFGKYLGTKIHSDVYLTKLNEHTFAIEMDNISINNLLVPIHTHQYRNKFLHDKYFTKSDKASDLITKLRIPFLITKTGNQKIVSINFQNEDNGRLSRNIKRAIVNLINMRIKPLHKKHSYAYFTESETNFEGTYRTNYLITKYAYLSHEQDKRVTIRRYSSSNQNKLKYSNIRSNVEPFIHTHTDNLRNFNEVVMNASINNNQLWFIWDVSAKSQWDLGKPGHKLNEYPGTFSLQNLIFVEATTSKSYDDLAKFSDQSSVLMDLDFDVNKLTSEQRSTLKQLIIDDVINRDQIQSIISLMKSGDVEDFQNIFNLLQPENNSIKLYYLELISNVNTKSSIIFYLKNILDFVECTATDSSKYNGLETVLHLSKMANFQSLDSEEVLMEMMRVLKAAVILRNKPCLHEFFKTLLLSFGSIYYKSQLLHPANKIAYYSILHDRSNLMRTLLKILEQDLFLNVEETKVITVKLIGNLGLDMHWDYLVNKYRAEKSQLIKQQIIRSMRKLSFPEVGLFLLEIYSDINEFPRLRITAAETLIMHCTDQSTLDMLVLLINKEPVDQVKGHLQQFILFYHSLAPEDTKFHKILSNLDRVQISRSYIRSVNLGVLIVLVNHDMQNWLNEGETQLTLYRKCGEVIFEELEITVVFSPSKFVFVKRFGNDIIAANLHNYMHLLPQISKVDLKWLQNIFNLVEYQEKLPSLTGMDIVVSRRSFLSQLSIESSIENQNSQLINMKLNFYTELSMGVANREMNHAIYESNTITKFNSPIISFDLSSSSLKLIHKNEDPLMFKMKSRYLYTILNGARKIPIYSKHISKIKQMYLPNGNVLQRVSKYGQQRTLRGTIAEVLLDYEISVLTVSKKLPLILEFNVSITDRGISVKEYLTEGGKPVYKESFLTVTFGLDGSYIITMPKYHYLRMSINKYVIKKDTHKKVQIVLKINKSGKKHTDEYYQPIVSISGSIADNQEIYENFTLQAEQDLNMLHIPEISRYVELCSKASTSSILATNNPCQSFDKFQSVFNRFSAKFRVSNFGQHQLVSIYRLINLIDRLDSGKVVTKPHQSIKPHNSGTAQFNLDINGNSIKTVLDYPSYTRTDSEMIGQAKIMQLLGLSKLVDRSTVGICVINRVSSNKNRIFTFDGVQYPVIEQNTPRYAKELILVENSQFRVSEVFDVNKKMVQIRFIYNEVKFLVDIIRDYASGNTTLSLNKMSLDGIHQFIWKRINLLKINRNEQLNLVNVDIRPIDVSVATNVLESISIKIPSKFYDQVQGFCGDSNGESINEFKWRDCSQVTLDSTKFYAESGYRIEYDEEHWDEWTPTQPCRSPDNHYYYL